MTRFDPSEWEQLEQFERRRDDDATSAVAFSIALYSCRRRRRRRPIAFKVIAAD